MRLILNLSTAKSTLQSYSNKKKKRGGRGLAEQGCVVELLNIQICSVFKITQRKTT